MMTLTRYFAKIAALSYTIGLFGFVMTFFGLFEVTQMPTAMHAIITVLPAYSVIGFALHRKQIVAPNLYYKVVYSLIALHQGATALMHAYSLLSPENKWMETFPSWYIYFATVYFSWFLFHCLTLKIIR